MSRLIFLNLAIDTLWDAQKNLQQVFPARIPESEYLVRANENLGLFFSDKGDTVLGHYQPKGYQDFLNARNAALGTLVPITAHPYDVIEWCKEVKSTLANVAAGTEIFSASNSVLEERLKKELALKLSFGTAVEQARLNQKTVLIELASLGLCKVPKTQIISQQQLIDLKDSSAVEGKILKHNFGSGGGGNFRGSQLSLLQRRLSRDVESAWLVQEEVEALFEGSIFNDPRDSSDGNYKPWITKVLYTAQGLSFSHEFATELDTPTKDAIFGSFQKVREHLRTLKYDGPIGIDFIVTKDKQVLFVDLNLRWTKTHAIVAAARKLGVPVEQLISLRHRWKSAGSCTYTSWWESMTQELVLNDQGENAAGLFLVPYSVSGIEGPGALKEVSLFYSKNENFAKQVQSALERFTEETK